MSVAKQSFPFGSHTVTIETGELARQADGAVFFDVRAAGVPALQRLTLVTDQTALASAASR